MLHGRGHAALFIVSGSHDREKTDGLLRFRVSCLSRFAISSERLCKARRTKQEPMNPAPPVTMIFINFYLASWENPRRAIDWNRIEQQA